MEKLKFNSDGKFRIMQIADVQEIVMTSADTVNLIDKAIEKAKPDLIVFTGDQIKGYGISMKFGNSRENAEKVLSDILAPLKKHNIPFVFTFGNHDLFSDADGEYQKSIYESTGLCMNKYLCDYQDCGFAYTDIFSYDGERNIFNVYLFDTGNKYRPVSDIQINAYRNIRDKSNDVKALAFQHIPPVEIYEKLTVTKKSKTSFRGAKDFSDRYYTISDEMKQSGMFMGENAACPMEKSNQLEAFEEKHDVLGLFFGHDHNNSFVINYNGTDLGYTQGCGFNTYGPALKRGVRIFDLDSKDTSSYKTFCLTYEELLGKKLKRPVTEYLYTHSPSSVSVAIPFYAKRLCIIAGACIAIGLAKHFVNKECL